MGSSHAPLGRRAGVRVVAELLRVAVTAALGWGPETIRSSRPLSISRCRWASHVIGLASLPAESLFSVVGSLSFFFFGGVLSAMKREMSSLVAPTAWISVRDAAALAAAPSVALVASPIGHHMRVRSRWPLILEVLWRPILSRSGCWGLPRVLHRPRRSPSILWGLHWSLRSVVISRLFGCRRCRIVLLSLRVLPHRGVCA